MIITVIAYRENAVDTCRGCVMGRYDSGLEIFSSDDQQAVIDWIVNLRARTIDDYNSYYFTYLVDGRFVKGDQYVEENFYEDLDADSNDLYWDILERIGAAADAQVTAFVEQRKQDKADAAVAEARRIAEQRRVADLAQLKALKEQYPDAY